jgi:Relaxase/Mobilisation nuclease domain
MRCSPRSAMVVKGSARGNAADLAAHLLSSRNERAEVIELRGVAGQDLRSAFLEIELVGSGTRSRRPFYHASINPDPGEQLTAQQRAEAVDRLEAELGLAGQPRAVIEHAKKGRTHWHVVWSRVDLRRMAMIDDSHNYRRHELVARECERAFGHAKVQGAHVEREDAPRPKRTPRHAEMQQAERSGITPQAATAQVTALWRVTDSGRSFAAALADHGWILARGDRRDFVVIDPAGETHSLARRIEGVKAADVRARMADVDRATLPSIEDARAQQQEQRQARVLSAEPQRPGQAGEVLQAKRTAPAIVLPAAEPERAAGAITIHSALLRDAAAVTTTRAAHPSPPAERRREAGDAARW